MDELHLCLECEAKGEGLKLSENAHNYFIIKEAKDNHFCQGCGRFHISLDTVRIVGPFIGIKPMKKELFYRDKIVIPQTAKFWRLWCIGTVEKLGDKKIYRCKYTNVKGNQMGKQKTYGHPEVVVGDSVLVETLSLRLCLLGGDFIYLVHYSDVVAIIEDPSSFFIF